MRQTREELEPVTSAVSDLPVCPDIYLKYKLVQFFWRWQQLSQSLCGITTIRSISILFIVVIAAQVIGSDCEGSLSDKACH